MSLARCVLSKANPQKGGSHCFVLLMSKQKLNNNALCSVNVSLNVGRWDRVWCYNLRLYGVLGDILRVPLKCNFI